MLGLPEKDARDSNEVVAAVRRWLGREPGYLLILDSADDPALVKPYLPPDPRGHVLLTSRAHTFDVLGVRKPIRLPVLPPDEALEFLGKRTGREESLDPAEQEAARTLAEELGYLPLALEQAAAYMVEHEEAFSVYLAAYRTLRLKLLDEMGPVAGEYPETVRTTWKRSFDAVAAASPAASALLRLSTFFAPDAIPYELIVEGASELGEPLAPALACPPGGEHALNQLLTPLARHSLVRRAPEARTYAVHRLVQAVLLDELTAATRKDLAKRAVKALSRTFPYVDYASWPRCDRLVPHALAARGWIEGEDLRVPEAARLLNRAGYYLHQRARYAEAEPLYCRALAINEQTLGPDHPDTVQSLNNLAVVLNAQGRPGETEPLFRRALAINEQTLGPDHPDTAQSLNNLAVVLNAQGWPGEAEPLFRRALAINEQTLGPDHPDTAQSLNNLAAMLNAQGRPEEAEPLFRRALAIYGQAMGPDNLDTAQSLNNLAAMLNAQGRPEEAEPLLRRALAICEAKFGPEHSHTVRCRENLAKLLSRPDWAGEGKADRDEKATAEDEDEVYASWPEADEEDVEDKDFTAHSAPFPIPPPPAPSTDALAPAPDEDVAFSDWAGEGEADRDEKATAEDEDKVYAWFKADEEDVEDKDFTAHFDPPFIPPPPAPSTDALAPAPDEDVALTRYHRHRVDRPPPARPAPDEDVALTRYPSIEPMGPAWSDQPLLLRIDLTRSLIDESTVGEPVRIADIPRGWQWIAVDFRLASPDLIFRNGGDEGTILVYRGSRSDPCIIKCRVGKLEPGRQSIEVTAKFFYEARWCGTARRVIPLTGGEAVPPPAPVAGGPAAATIPTTLVEFVGPPPPSRPTSTGGPAARAVIPEAPEIEISFDSPTLTVEIEKTEKAGRLRWRMTVPDKYYNLDGMPNDLREYLRTR